MAKPKKKNASPFAYELLLLAAPCIMAWYYCGERALRVLLVSVASAVLCDLAGGLLFYNKIVIKDLCSVFTGVAIAMMLPSSVPFYIPVIGSLFAIAAVKLPFGGAFNAPAVPAAAGFAFITVCFPEQVFLFPTSATNASGQFVSGVSLAGMLRQHRSMHLDSISVFDVLSGNVSGAMGTGCAIVLLGCALCLLFRRRKAFFNTIGFIAACSVMALLFPRVNTGLAASLITELCSGSLLFASVFLVTDPSVSPEKPLYRLLFGCITGVICMITRYFGIYEEGVCFAVIISGFAWPLIEKGIDLLLSKLAQPAKRKEAA